MIRLCRTPRCGAGAFTKLGTRKGEAPAPTRKRVEIRFDKDLDRLSTGINLDTNRRITKVKLVASSVLSSNDGVGHYRFALTTADSLANASSQQIQWKRS